jgi:hypothetical protein
MAMRNNSAAFSSEFPTHAGLIKLVVCAVGICSCYLCYGVLQERFFRENVVGATFLLVTQCITNTLVAVCWQKVDRAYSGAPKQKVELNHPLLLLSELPLCFLPLLDIDSPILTN